MGVGETFREGFEYMVQEMGDDILIYKHWNTPSQTVTEVRGLKNNEKGRLDKVMFQFLEDPGVVAGDVLQQKGARELWRVSHVHDEVISGVYQNFEADVESMSAPAKPASRTGHNVVVHGAVHGGVQIESAHAVQHNNVQISHIENNIQQLKELLASSALPDLDKEEAALALARVSDLAARPKTPDVLAKIGEKIEAVKTIISSLTPLASVASPLLRGLWDKIQNG